MQSQGEKILSLTTSYQHQKARSNTTVKIVTDMSSTGVIRPTQQESNDFCSSIQANTHKHSEKEMRSFASSICSADEKMFNEQVIHVRVSSIGSAACGLDQAMNLPRRKSNSYLMATFNPSQKASFQSSLNRVSRQTKTFIVEEQQEEETKAAKDEEEELNYITSHRGPFELSEGARICNDKQRPVKQSFPVL